LLVHNFLFTYTTPTKKWKKKEWDKFCNALNLLRVRNSVTTK